jgi:hypothetical protein
MTQKRKRLSGPEKIAIFEHGADVFDPKKGRQARAAESAKDARIS